MKSTTIKLKPLLTCVLQEQVDLNRVNKAYLKTIDAVAGLGTDVPAVLIAIKMLRNRNEFLEYMVKFNDKKTGYSSFPEMINAEYDRFNLSDVQQIVAALRNINVRSNVIVTKNIFGKNLFSKFKMEWMKIPTITKKNYSIYKKQWLTLLPKAVLWWKNWLSSPITQKKVQSNWDTSYPKGLVSVKYIFPDYFKMLDSLKIKFYDETDLINWTESSNAYAFVKGPFNTYGDNTIYVNLKQNDPDPYGTLIHEIQHIIYGIMPLNPEEKIHDIFVTKNTKRATTKSIEASGRTRINPDAQTLKRAAIVIKSLGLDMDAGRLVGWKRYAQAQEKVDPAYVCRATEKMSNIMSIRSHFKLKPGQNITIAMLKPYIERKKTNIDISWIILCWATNGFPNLYKMINRINTLAVNNTGTNRGPNVA
jgi:hypothetical protein